MGEVYPAKAQLIADGLASERPPGAGLSAAEASRRAEQGLANVVVTRERRDREIVRGNAFTFFNIILVSLIVTLLVLAAIERDSGLVKDGLFVGVVAIANAAIGSFQEVRATRSLRQLVLLTAPHVRVVRDGEEVEILARDVVQGDLLHLRQGDQVVADGPIAAGMAEVNESLLTGEASSVRRGPGDELLSGSYCMAGGCFYTAGRVGAEAYALKLTADARTLVKRLTPLQLRFNRILRVLLRATIVLGALLMISYNVGPRGFAEAVKATTATATAVVPEGLLLSLTVAFAIGAVRVSRKRAIVQDISAVEALNYLDIVCLDKTGTITANRLTLREVRFLPGEERQAPWLGAFAAASAGESGTATALAAALAATSNGAQPAGSAPFNSERRWSAQQLELSAERRTFVLGAPEPVLPLCSNGDELWAAYETASAAGLRGVIFAEADDLPAPDQPPAGLRALALITLADELRAGVSDAFATMAQLGIEPRIISGDNPRTVAALVAQLRITLRGGGITGAELEKLEGEQFVAAVEQNSIFGRIAPAQKAAIVQALRGCGHFVAMVGDGANDVQALRAADVAVAMASGTETARAVSGIVLLDDSFAAFIAGTKEARAVLGNAARLSKLFLAKSVYAFLIIIATSMLGLNFPFLPRHGSLTALLTLGIPAIFISMSVPPLEAGRDFTRSVLRFALPAAFALAAAAILVHLFTEGVLRRPVEEARTLVSLTLGVTGLFFMLEVLGFEGASLRNPTRPFLTAVLSGLLMAGLVVTIYTPDLRRFFDFTEVGPGQWAVVITAVIAALAGQYVLARYWPQLLDLVIAKPPTSEEPRGRQM